MTAFDADHPRLGRTWLGWLRTLGLSLAVACVAGRVLYPSEDAANGSGTVFVLLELVCGVFLAADLWFDESRTDERAPFRAWLWLIAAVWISAMFASNRFAGKMMAWEWTGMGVVSLYFMQQSSRIGPRPMAMFVVALALSESFLALWQVGVEFPDLRRRFAERDPSVVAVMQETAEQLGIDPAKLGERLLQSKEAHGTYGLANSLAGLLSFVLPMLAAIAFQPNFVSAFPTSIVRRIAVFAPFVAVFLAIVATKSRSGAVAGVLGCLAIPLANGAATRLWRQYWRRIVLLFAIAAVVVGSMVLAGQIDWQDLNEGPKSLSYRLEWWRGSAGVFAENPLFGVGFGSFGTHYLRYKLPFSSEEVRDPHNFIVELACCGGLFTLAAYLLLLITSVRAVWQPLDDPPVLRDGNANQRLGLWFSAGALLATLILTLGRFLGGIGGFGWMAVLAGFAAVVYIQRSQNALPVDQYRRTIVIEAVGLHLNWMIAGGVSFPGVALPAWTMLASSMTPSKPATLRRTSMLSLLAGTVFFSTLPIVYFIFFHVPLARREQILNGIRSMNRRDADHILMAYRQAALALPGDPDGWLRLAEAHASGLRVGNEDFRRRHYQEAQSAFREAIRLDPRRSTLYRQLGLLEQEAATQKLDPSARENARSALQAMVANYPNSAVRRWDFGRFLWQTGDLEPARAEFRVALELDQTPHPDKKLSIEQREFARGCLPK